MLTPCIWIVYSFCAKFVLAKIKSVLNNYLIYFRANY